MDNIVGNRDDEKVIIKARNLVKYFFTGENKQVILDGLDLDIIEGDFTVIMGPSGAGKSTLMYSLSGIDRPQGGEIYFNNININSLSEDRMAVFRRKQCGFVFQQVYLLEKMSLMDNVIIAGTLTNSSRADLVSKAKGLFKWVNISETVQQKAPNQVSGGEAQRVGIVRAIMNDPKVVFADEPTGALNSSNSDAVLDLLSDVNKRGQSIIMVTHDKKSALRGNRVLYLKDGKIIGDCKLGVYKAEDSERLKKLESFLKTMGW